MVIEYTFGDLKRLDLDDQLGRRLGYLERQGTSIWCRLDFQRGNFYALDRSII